MDELRCRRATLKRDLEYLRERLDAPIVYDRFDNGYRFDAERATRAQASTSCRACGSARREIHALLTMHQLIQGLDDGGVLARHLQPLLDKLHGMLGTSDAEARELMKRVKIVDAGAAAGGEPASSSWSAARCCSAGACRCATTRAAARESRAQRVAAAPGALPQHLVPRRLVPRQRRAAPLRARRDPRGATLLEQRAKDVAMKTVEAELDAGYGIFGGAAGCSGPRCASRRGGAVGGARAVAPAAASHAASTTAR